MDPWWRPLLLHGSVFFVVGGNPATIPWTERKGLAVVSDWVRSRGHPYLQCLRSSPSVSHRKTWSTSTDRRSRKHRKDTYHSLWVLEAPRENGGTVCRHSSWVKETTFGPGGDAYPGRRQAIWGIKDTGLPLLCSWDLGVSNVSPLNLQNKEAKHRGGKGDQHVDGYVGWRQKFPGRVAQINGLGGAGIRRHEIVSATLLWPNLFRLVQRNNFLESPGNYKILRGSSRTKSELKDLWKSLASTLYHPFN